MMEKLWRLGTNDDANSRLLHDIPGGPGQLAGLISRALQVRFIIENDDGLLHEYQNNVGRCDNNSF